MEDQVEVVEADGAMGELKLGLGETMRFVGTAMKRAKRSMNVFSVRDLLVGTRFLARQQAAEREAQGPPVVARAAAVFSASNKEDALRTWRLCKAAYKKGREDAEAVLGQGLEVVDMLEGRRLCPAMVLVRDTARRRVVVALRGTQSVNDVLADIAAHAEPLEKDFGFGFCTAVRAECWC